jgi:uncharacterized protein (PEP-CTERM system associated)
MMSPPDATAAGAPDARRRQRRTAWRSLASAVLIAGSIGCVEPAGAQPYGGGGAPAAPDTGAAAEGTRRGGQRWYTEASVTGLTTVTNNANYGEGGGGLKEGDVILELIPSLRFNREGARLRVSGDIALDMLAYLDGTQVNRILPQASVLANLEAVDNLFFVDASFTANQQVENPFLPRTGFASTNNLYTYAQTRLVPYLRGNFGPLIEWQLRSDNSYTWTTQTTDPLSDVYFGSHLAEVTRQPTPFGLTLRASSDVTRFKDQVQPDQTLKTALAILDYAFTPQFTFGLRGGYEVTTYTADETSGPIYGANLAWRPSPLTSAIGYWEHRFYGPSYQFDVTHRHRRLASSLSFYRTITTYPQLLFRIPPTGNVSGLLDAIMVARFPDPVERAREVQDLIARQALPESLPGGAFIYNQSANILTGASATTALVGARNTISLNIFYLKTELLPDARLPPTFVVSNNSEQYGAGVSLSHRLSPVASVTGTVSGLETRGFGPTEGLRTQQGLASLQLNWQASPRTTWFVGTRYQYQTDEGTVASLADSSEAAIFAGLIHRL